MKKLPVLQLNRLTLRSFELSDAADVQRLAGDRAIADTTCNIPYPYNNGEAEAWIGTHQEHLQKGQHVSFAVTLSGSRELIGAMGFGINDKHDRAELGYWIGVPYWGNGYCTEAARAVLDYGFAEWKLNRIHACFLSRNPASGRVMEKIGMKKEGVLRQHIKKWDVYEDVVVYGILRDEWADHTASDS